MTVRFRSFVLAAVGLWMAQPLPGQEPLPMLMEPGPRIEMMAPANANQRMADAIAQRLQQSAQLMQCMIHVSFQGGMVELSGGVATEAQRQEVVRLVQTVPGVVRVQDNMLVSVIVPAQATRGEPPVLPPATPVPAPRAPAGGFAPNLQGNGQPVPFPNGGPNGGPMEPMPMYQHAAPSPYDLNPPRMPPHAWPTYAPYNNVSRVAYPDKYPYQAWPFIGPFYPFPKVPLGWRSVKLEWQDGHWWFGKTATCNDWWRIRYW